MPVNIRALLFSALAFFSASVVESSISDCSKGASLLKPTDLALSPDPPQRGQPLYMTVKFDNPGADITDGIVTTSVTLNYIPFSPTVEALCTNTQCPLTSGPNDRSTSNMWPDSVSGKVISKIEWSDTDGSQLLCIQISASVNTNKTALRGASPLFNYTDNDAAAVTEALRLDAPIELNSMNDFLLYSPWTPPMSLPPMCDPSEMSMGLILWNNHSVMYNMPF